MNRIQTILILSLSPLFATGCLTSPAEEPEHHVSAHMPPNFPAAVLRLSQLHDEFIHHSTQHSPRPATRETGDSHHSNESAATDPYAEMCDILRWLPQFAADSDLPEASWNRVNTAALALETVLEPLKNLEDDSWTAAYRESAKHIEKHLEQINGVSLDAFPDNGQVEENEL